MKLFWGSFTCKEEKNEEIFHFHLSTTQWFTHTYALLPLYHTATVLNRLFYHPQFRPPTEVHIKVHSKSVKTKNTEQKFKIQYNICVSICKACNASFSMLSGISCTGWHRFWQMITKIQIAFAQAYNSHYCCFFFPCRRWSLREEQRERFSDQNEKSGLLLKRTEPMAPVLLLLSFHLPSKSRRGIRESFSFFCVLDR